MSSLELVVRFQVSCPLRWIHPNICCRTLVGSLSRCVSIPWFGTLDAGCHPEYCRRESLYGVGDLAAISSHFGRWLVQDCCCSTTLVVVLLLLLLLRHWTSTSISWAGLYLNRLLNQWWIFSKLAANTVPSLKKHFMQARLKKRKKNNDSIDLQWCSPSKQQVKTIYTNSSIS